MSGAESTGAALTIGLIVFVLYFLPALVAWDRKHNQAGAITVLNLFLGWTFIGWVAAMVWSATSDVKSKQEKAESSEANS